MLLDVDYTAKVADFELEVPLPYQVGTTSVVSVAGAIRLASNRGYIAPEFNDSERGTKCDVYSYGIVSFHINYTMIVLITLF